MKRVLSVLFLLSVFIPLSAQTTVRWEIDSSRVVATTIANSQIITDPNGYLYIFAGAKLQQIDQNGQLIHTFCDPFLGDISSVDADNPLKIMLFYRDAGKILFLNNKLSPITEPLDLLSAPFGNISLAAYSTDNRIWLFNEMSQTLYCVDFHLREIFRNSLTFNNFTPNQLWACQEKQLVMNVPNDGIYLFDAFGTFLQRLPLATNQLIGNQRQLWVYATEGGVSWYHSQRMDGDKMPLSPHAQPAAWLPNQLYYFDEQQRLIHVFYRVTTS